MTAAAKPASNGNGNGCGYGRANRWAIGILVTLLVALAGIGARSVSNATAEINRVATGMAEENKAQSEDIQANRESAARVDERLKAIQEDLRELKAMVKETRP